MAGRFYDVNHSSSSLVSFTDIQKQQQPQSPLQQLSSCCPESSEQFQKLQIPPKTISHWFQHIILLRILKAVICIALYCIIVYFIAACILQISLLHPIQTTLDIVSLLFSFRSVLYALVFSIFGALNTALFAFFVLRFDSEERLSCRSLRAWIIYFGSLNIALAQVICLSVGSNSPDFSRFFIYFLAVAQAVVTFHEVFRVNHRLVFPVIEMRPYMQLNFVLAPAAKSVLDARLFRIIKWAGLFIIVCGLPIFGLSIFRNLLNISLCFSTSVLLLVHMFLHHIAVGLIKVFILQSFEFTMPPPHAILNPTPEDQRTLMDALESNGITKAFAFWDLRSLSAACHRRRQIIFSLSQPGGHPRKWNAVKLSCLRQIQFLNIQFENENDRIRSQTFASVTGPLLPPDGHRPAILCQTTWQKDGIRQRIIPKNLRKEDKDLFRGSILNKLPLFLDKLKGLICVSHRIVSFFDVYLGILAIESIAALICVSLNEDHFGVVQKDLREVVSVLLQFCNNLERYMRSAKEDREWQNKTCVPLLTSITMALNRIRFTFPDGSISKLLSPQEVSYFDKLTSID
uniref:Nucleoporin protein Ndc1-Nup n=1 Tax=Setaria digitata TaxID=48799 RepID=A0A915Q5V5_9BILA